MMDIIVMMDIAIVPPALIGKGLVGIELGTTGISQTKLFPSTTATQKLLAIWQATI
jgi:hypothetical protein